MLSPEINLKDNNFEESDVDSESSSSKLSKRNPRSVLSSSSLENLNDKIPIANSSYSMGNKTNNELILDNLKLGETFLNIIHNAY